jgi:hypothetical protein
MTAVASAALDTADDRIGIPPMSAPLGWGQFVFGPTCPSPLPSGWSSRKLPRRGWLATHPDLRVTSVAADARALTLIGFMLDPQAPNASDATILERLFQRCDRIAHLLEATAGYGGRWALVADCDDGRYLFTDALGLRQALYADHDPAGVWVVSQAGLALDVLGLGFDPDAQRFIDSYAVRARTEYRWPGASTPVAGLKHLLPNRVLDLDRARVRRYWPRDALLGLDLDEAVERLSALLRGLIAAAAARFDLALSLTAGIDSRLVLAAARPFMDRIDCVTVRQARMADDHKDLQVPARLCARLGLRHHIVRAAGSMSPEFSWAYKRNVFLAHDLYGPDAEAILARFGRRKVALTGSGAEVGRCSFRKQLPFSRLRRISAADLAWLQGMYHPYAIRSFQAWLDDVGDTRNVKLLDLFEWEQGHGNWLAMTQLEFDIAWRDIFTPYNCRALLTTLLRVRESLRRAPDYALFKVAIGKLWPDLLAEPINPGASVGALLRGVRFVRQSWRSYVHAPGV